MDRTYHANIPTVKTKPLDNLMRFGQRVPKRRQQMRNGLLVVVLAVVACGVDPGGAGGTQHVQQQVPDMAQPQVSGSRLKAIWHVGTDGSRLASGMFFDTVLGVNCVVSETRPSGPMACLPTGVIVAEVSRSYFSDDTCTHPVALGIPDAVFAHNSSTGTYSAAVPFSGQVFTISGGSCASASVPNGSVPYQLGDDVQPVMFSDSVG